jgi:hypothetical protein
MQLISRYLVTNRIDLVVDVAGFVTEYRPVYKRTIKVYKGIDNVLQFRLLNADQKPINTTLYTPKFVAFDENKNLIIEHDGTILDDGSTSTRGLFTITITENDLLNIKQQYVSYNVYLVDVNDEKILTYTDTHFGNDGIMEVSADAFPGAKSSSSVSTFSQSNINNDEWISSAIDAQPGLNGNEALHTAAFYTSSFEGNITVQATLENQITGLTNWANITTVSFTGTETTPVPVSFNGVFNFIRFVADADPANKITKILVRN